MRARVRPRALVGRRAGEPLDTDDAQFREAFEAQYLKEQVLRFLWTHADVEWRDDKRAEES